MSLSFTEQAVVTELATLLYEFLPASGNNATSFPLAAAQSGLAQGWPAQPGVSKRPGITHLVRWTLEHRRDRFCALIEVIVGQSMQWRSRKPDPLSRAEIEHLNRLLERLHFKIPALWDNAFLESLPGGGNSAPSAPAAKSTTATVVSEDRRSALQRALLELHALEPQPRGFAFEKFVDRNKSVTSSLVNLSIRLNAAPAARKTTRIQQVVGRGLKVSPPHGA